MKYFIVTFGCQMNEADSERIISLYENKGYKACQKIEQADLVIVNMCSVRQSAVDRVIGLKPKLKGKKTILTGCILKKDKAILSKIFDEIIDIKDIKAKPIHLNKYSISIPIMTGCNNFCSYCVVPYTRGREKSTPAKDIIKEINGYKEIWLLGQNVNSYKDIGFANLLKEINKIKREFWVRFTSSHPKDFSDDVIKAMKEKITPYLNLPVQSGDDKILKKMNRPYTIKKYKNIIKKVRKQIPNITISTDVIVGFPGETKAQFNNTAKLFREIKYDMAYINKYSPRAGTAAFNLKDDISPKEKKNREKILTEILKQTALENNKKHIDKTTEVLVDSYKDGYCIGKSYHYKTVKFKGKKSFIGIFIKVKITEALPWSLKGEIKKPLKN
jgi:tRNA-2-methylthio-N6-dimethylallyladenosine synthase